MIKFFALLLIRAYKLIVSPLLGQHCRFYPTCSTYALSAIQKHGLLVGGAKSTKRLLKCHPWSHGGVDLP